MSNEPKKYPADTPVTLQMIVEFHEAYGATSLADRWRIFIEPPKPEPKEGELWLCQHIGSGDRFALWKFTEGWAVFQTGVNIYRPEMVTPLTRIIPMKEDGNE